MTIGNYSIIYADPPWQYQRSKVQGAAENHYPTMGIDELCALPVADLAAPDSALFFMDFSLLSPLEFFADPKNGDGRNNKPPAMRVRVDCYTKKLPFRLQ